MSMTYKKFRGRYFVVVTSSLLVWLMLLFRMFFIQVIDAERLGDIIETRFEDKVVIPPLRGNFYDRNGKKLTDNVEHYTFSANPDKVTDKEGVARLFSHKFNKSKNNYLRKLNSDKPFVYLERNVTPELGQQLALEIQGTGVRVQSEVRRYYPYGDVAAPLIGFVGTDNHGLSGLESHYDHQLAGIEGWRELGSDGKGQTRIRGGFREKKALNGNDCFLTLDIDLQIIIEEELRAAMELHEAKRAMAVLVDPQNGEILALANLPGFNPNTNSNVTQAALTSHPIMSAFEPGSTFKVVGATALLEHGVVDPMDVFYCENGEFSIHGINIADWRPFENLTFAEVLQNSSNIGIIKAVQKLGDKQLFSVARKFGFSEKSGIQYPYENEGILKNSKYWSTVSKSEISIGYEVSVTALQMAMAYSAIGNGGVLLKPQLIRSFQSPTGYTQEVDHMDAIRRVASEATMNTLSGILEKAVSTGTGNHAYLPNLRIAGKTGTAKKLQKGKYVSKYIASFASFFPSEHPQYTLIVVIDEPQRQGYTGGMVAAPVAKEIYRRIYNLRESDQVPYRQARHEPDVEGDSPPVSNKGQLLSSTYPVLKAGAMTMPDLHGMSMKMSLTGLYAMGVQPITHGSGRVIRQIPQAGTRLQPGQKIEIFYGMQ